MLQHLIDLTHQATTFLGGPAVAGTIATFLGLGGLDVILRLVKTDKPATVLVGIRKVIGSIVALLQSVSGLLTQLDSVIDRVIPQRLASDETDKQDSAK